MYHGCTPIQRNKTTNIWSLGKRSLSWKFHIKRIVVKISRLVGIIAKLRHFVKRNILLRIYQSLFLYSWRVSRYSAPIHWLVHGHMTSNNETVSLQMPEAGNTAKTMTSNGKQLPAKCWPLLHVSIGGLMLSWESQRVFQNLLLFVLLYNKPLNDWSLGEQWILFPSNVNVSLDFISGNIEILGKQNSLFPLGPVIKF